MAVTKRTLAIDLVNPLHYIPLGRIIGFVAMETHILLNQLWGSGVFLWLESPRVCLYFGFITSSQLFNPIFSDPHPLVRLCSLYFCSLVYLSPWQLCFLHCCHCSPTLHRTDFILPVNLPVGSPWPLLLCRRKKSLLLSVTQSFRAFFSRTSSGFNHISSNRERSTERNPSAASACVAGLCETSSGCPPALERPDRCLQRRVFGFVHDYPAQPTAESFGLPWLVRCLTPDMQQLYTQYEDRL